MKKSYCYLIAKNDSTTHKWLPLWVHSIDTYHVMKYLTSHWMTESALHAVTDTISFDRARLIALFLAVFHDYGKSSMLFQAKITEGAEELWRIHNNVGLFTPAVNDPELRNAQEMPHGVAGEIMLLAKGCPASIAAVVGAHHGKPWEKGPDIEEEIQEILEEEEDIHKNFTYGLRLWGGKSRREKWSKAQEEFYRWALGVTEIDDVREIPAINDRVAVILSGLVIMADWLASNEDYFPLISYEQEAPDDIAKRTSDAVEKINMPPVWSPVGERDCRSLFFKRFGFIPNSVQEEMVNAVMNSEDPGLFILEAPMGLGKTEAALAAAEQFSDSRVSGMLFALPTQATANGIFTRIIEWGEKQTNHNAISIRLAHGRALMNDEYTALIDTGKHAECNVDDYEENRLIVHDFFQGRKQSLLADFVVGTVDQILLASLKQKHFMLRHLGLCGKAVIIDECHAYDAYMNEYLERTLQWLGAYRTPVIMLSATLPYERRSALVDAYLGKQTGKKDESWRKSMGYPLLTWTDGKKICQRELAFSGIRREVEIEKLGVQDTLEEQLDAVRRIITDNLVDGGCAAIIVNTVRRAQLIYERVQKDFPDKKALLLHSRFISEDRLEYEKELLAHAGRKSEKSDRDGFIVIGTQVIEQSLDFDVDLMITDLCPMDLFLQRLGRLHRHPVHDEYRPIRLEKAKCFVIGAGEKLEKGSVSIYGSYLLMRTRSLLPEKITLPDDIAVLVQNVYDENFRITEEPSGYETAYKEHKDKRYKMKRDADAFRLLPPGKEKTINRFLEASALADEEQARAQVRNGEEAVDVLVMFSGDTGITRAPWRYRDSFDYAVCPSVSSCRAISNQRVSLPVWIKGMLPISKLSMPPAWEQSVWLKGQRFLLLNEQGEAELGDLIIRYGHKTGLQVERRD